AGAKVAANANTTNDFFIFKLPLIEINKYKFDRRMLLTAMQGRFDTYQTTASKTFKSDECCVFATSIH
ncbi:MAG TPA: hypothetical protein PKL58_04335, partial [Methylophilaceae bacterium]|nr:hypothetical protein [Methylophilaceae bacterium]